MSQIFDALHQSATERADSGASEFAAASDLLQMVERKVGVPAPVVDGKHAVRRNLTGQWPVAKPELPAESRLVCLTEAESLAAEKFRFLATRLRHMQQKRSLKRLVITSSVAGEGKSMIAANLACALAAGKQRVLLLEGDLRRPSLGQQLGLRDLPGLSQLLQNGRGASNNVFCLEGFGLCVLLAGDFHINPLEFMEPAKLSAIVNTLAADFEWIVIDSPPVLPLADTSIWMRLADAVMLVTRPGVTAKHQLQRALETVEHSKLLGAVLNASTEATGNHYYYHYAARPGATQPSDPSVK
jgi:capsular exopolysaccharide synthesis family protein